MTPRHNSHLPILNNSKMVPRMLVGIRTILTSRHISKGRLRESTRMIRMLGIMILSITLLELRGRNRIGSS